MTNSTDIARAMADTMAHAAIPMYGKKLRLPDRSAIISLIRSCGGCSSPPISGIRS